MNTLADDNQTTSIETLFAKWEDDGQRLLMQIEAEHDTISARIEQRRLDNIRDEEYRGVLRERSRTIRHRLGLREDEDTTADSTLIPVGRTDGAPVNGAVVKRQRNRVDRVPVDYITTTPRGSDEKSHPPPSVLAPPPLSPDALGSERSLGLRTRNAKSIHDALELVARERPGISRDELIDFVVKYRHCSAQSCTIFVRKLTRDGVITAEKKPTTYTHGAELNGSTGLPH